MFDRIVSLVTLSLGILVVYLSQQLPKPIFAGQLGTGVFPTGIGALMIIVSLLLFRESRKNQRETSPDERSELRWNRNLTLTIGIIIFYVLIFQVLGFVISSALFILALGWTLGARKWLPLTVISVAFPSALYALFAGLGINLPAGILPF